MVAEQNQSSDNQTDHVSKLSSVASYLFWVSASWAVFMGVGFFGAVLLILLNLPEGDDSNFMLLTGAYNVVFGVYSLLICAGAFQMMRTRAYALSVAAAAMSCVPVMSPWGLIGIPLGIWCLVLLFKPEVKAAFASKDVEEPTVADPSDRTLRKACGIFAGIVIWLVVFNVISGSVAFAAGIFDFNWEGISSAVMGFSHLIGILSGVLVAKLIMPKSIPEDATTEQDSEET